jgi:uncharacterized membrane protein YphA (DoxX/SURF4 family)
MNIALWIAQILLAGLFGFAGVLKTFQSIPKLSAMLEWPGQMPEWLVRFIGVAELAAAIGLILPMLTGILPWLAPLAALGLAIIQILAIIFHAQRGETAKSLPVNAVLLLLSLFIIWGRWDLF